MFRAYLPDQDAAAGRLMSSSVSVRQGLPCRAVAARAAVVARHRLAASRTIDDNTRRPEKRRFQRAQNHSDDGHASKLSCGLDRAAQRRSAPSQRFRKSVLRDLTNPVMGGAR
ncbi:hypothetical protein [Rhodovulum strictum]|uniref:Uncharacterized protein n=1 Tax=Rhodovulum strictum TaxID=58314 RepID=A0A844BJG9_9RHOB|nr:hypothetical protein [Rhodovulum strictum]MRH20147.1 hypothetical protein [Rhodovulum strictum]